jgi:hypothetical protein
MDPVARLDWTSVGLADGVWAAALVIMTEAWAPLQWNRSGQPVMRARRDVAVGFTPLVAMAGGLLLAAGARLGDPSETGWAMIRLVAPLALMVAHQAHLRGALKTLKVEGGLRRR